MKKIVLFLFSLIIMFSLFSCDVEVTTAKLSVVVPSGTPALGIADFVVNHKDECEIVEGTAVQAAFANQSTDIIIAPVNLGIKFYNTNQTYQLYNIYVWGNLYLVYNKEVENINSLSDLENKNVTSFQKGSTPEIVLSYLLKTNNISNVNVTYLAAVSDAMANLLSGTSSICVLAEPSLSKIRSNSKYGIIDLQEEWKKCFDSSSYPQAGIFVKKESLNKTIVKNALVEMVTSINKCSTDPSSVAESATKILTTFETLGKDLLYKSIPNCHFEIKDDNKTAVEAYCNALIELGFGKQIGDKLPDEKFYH